MCSCFLAEVFQGRIDKFALKPLVCRLMTLITQFFAEQTPIPDRANGPSARMITQLELDCIFQTTWTR